MKLSTAPDLQTFDGLLSNAPLVVINTGSQCRKHLFAQGMQQVVRQVHDHNKTLQAALP